jgi:MFS family permease
MMLSITCFSLVTLLSAFATGVWSFAILRFLAGVGIGGEWSIGGSLVSEEWPEERRTKGAAWMHTGYYSGFFLAAAANYFIGSREPLQRAGPKLYWKTIASIPHYYLTIYAPRVKYAPALGFPLRMKEMAGLTEVVAVSGSHG